MADLAHLILFFAINHRDTLWNYLCIFIYHLYVSIHFFLSLCALVSLGLNCSYFLHYKFLLLFFEIVVVKSNSFLKLLFGILSRCKSTLQFTIESLQQTMLDIILQFLSLLLLLKSYIMFESSWKIFTKSLPKLLLSHLENPIFKLLFHLLLNIHFLLMNFFYKFSEPYAFDLKNKLIRNSAPLNTLVVKIHAFKHLCVDLICFLYCIVILLNSPYSSTTIPPPTDSREIAVVWKSVRIVVLLLIFQWWFMFFRALLIHKLF